jgi:hypothetical protein
MLNPIDNSHAVQIQAGVNGRIQGHSFEDKITKEINNFTYPLSLDESKIGHVSDGNPALLLLNYIGYKNNSNVIIKASAFSSGSLATSEDGKKLLSINGVPISKCKSDIILQAEFENDIETTIGISTKQCNNRKPTNAQLYFTTARGFSNLLIDNGIVVSASAIKSMRQFCGDNGYRPLDDASIINRKSDPRRFFWDEIDETGRNEWEQIFNDNHDNILRLLLQKAYLNDPFAPEYLLHKTKSSSCWDTTEVAIYSINEIIALSKAYKGFELKQYSVRKGSYKDPPGVFHKAPRFGIVQMQRGGQAQHPEQLQFNLEAGYFYKI